MRPLSPRRLLTAVIALVLLAASGFAADPPAEETVDWNRARQLFQREQRGETLTADEQAFLKHAKELRQKLRQEGRNPEPNAPAQPGHAPMAPKDSTGLVPLTQLKGNASYKGEDGGLYGGGKNEPPAEHLAAAMMEAGKIVPLDADGRPSPEGKIVLLSIGMSNTTQEFSRFKELADADPVKSKQVVIVDGAQGGKEASAWNGSVLARAAGVWETVDARLSRAAVDGSQVQVLWIKQARANPAALGEFPKHAQQMEEDLIACLHLAKKRWPNVRIAYVSSRIYAGYASTALNPEPFAYEGAFSFRWLIRDQMKGDPRLNYDKSKGTVTSPLILWGPYLWADGMKGREGDDLIWKREDLGPDGTHPSNSGRQKVAELLLKFLKADPTAKPWFTVARKE